jgi:hypothetical protein
MCGAALPEGVTCEEVYFAGQAQEQADPAYYTVHHLSVPCYMLQHNAYSARGWRAVRDLLRRFVEEGLTPEQARQEMQGQAAGSRKGWSLTRGEKLAGVAEIHWSRTVADVRLDSPEHYCADVLAWARSILEDTREIR